MPFSALAKSSLTPAATSSAMILIQHLPAAHIRLDMLHVSSTASTVAPSAFRTDMSSGKHAYAAYASEHLAPCVCSSAMQVSCCWAVARPRAVLLATFFASTSACAAKWVTTTSFQTWSAACRSECWALCMRSNVVQGASLHTSRGVGPSNQMRPRPPCQRQFPPARCAAAASAMLSLAASKRECCASALVHAACCSAEPRQCSSL